MRVITVGEATWKPLILSLPRKRVNQEQYYISGEIAEISVTMKYLKDEVVAIPTILPLNAPFGLWEDRQVLENDCKLP